MVCSCTVMFSPLSGPEESGSQEQLSWIFRSRDFFEEEQKITHYEHCPMAATAHQSWLRR